MSFYGENEEVTLTENFLEVKKCMLHTFVITVRELNVLPAFLTFLVIIFDCYLLLKCFQSLSDGPYIIKVSGCCTWVSACERLPEHGGMQINNRKTKTKLIWLWFNCILSRLPISNKKWRPAVIFINNSWSYCCCLAQIRESNSGCWSESCKPLLHHCITVG